MSANELIVIGCGVLGKRIFDNWQGKFLGIVRSQDSLNELSATGISGSTKIPSGLSLESVIFATSGSPNQLSAVEQFVSLNPKFSGTAILISSTSYYQGVQGPVNETSAGGNTPRSIACQKLEHAFKSSFDAGWILRCGGLFEAGRGPFAYLSRTGQIPPLPTGQQLALFSYRDLQRLVLILLKEKTKQVSTLLCTLRNCPTRYDYYSAAFSKLNIPFNLSATAPCGPQYEPEKLYRIFEPIDSHWNDALQ